MTISIQFEPVHHRSLLCHLSSFRVMISLAFPNLNSSMTDVSGSYSLDVLLYIPILEKHGGMPSHLRRCLLMVLSNPSTDGIPISYSMSSHVNRGNNPCWKIQALDFPGIPVLWMLLMPSATCCSSLLTLLVSRKLSSYHFRKHLIGIPTIKGMVSSWTFN